MDSFKPTLLAGKSYNSLNGEPRMTCIVKEKDGYSVVIYDKDCEKIYERKTVTKDEVYYAAFYSVQKPDILIMRVDYGNTTEALTTKREPPFSTERIAYLPKGVIKQFRSNNFWGVFYALENGVMSLYSLDLERKDVIIQEHVWTQNKSPHVAVVGDSSSGTFVYLVEKHGKAFHLNWQLPAVTNRWDSGGSMELRFLNPLSENILFMENHKDLIVIVSQDNRMRKYKADLKVLVVKCVGSSIPEILSEITLEDYYAPLGVSFTSEGQLLLACKNTLSWIDINTKKTTIDGFVDTGLENVGKLVLVRTENGRLRILAWTPSPSGETMIATVFDTKGKKLGTIETPFEVTNGEMSKTFQAERSFFGTMRGEGYKIKCVQLDVK